MGVNEITEVFNKLRHPIRVRIIELLGEREGLSFTELLSSLSLNDKGKLAFHLRKLNDLIHQNPQTKAYSLSSLGQRAYGIIREERKQFQDWNKALITLQRREALRWAKYSRDVFFLGVALLGIQGIAIGAYLSSNRVDLQEQFVFWTRVILLMVPSFFFAWLAHQKLVKPIRDNKVSPNIRWWVKALLLPELFLGAFIGIIILAYADEKIKDLLQSPITSPPS